jgi:hypothetical protein
MRSNKTLKTLSFAVLLFANFGLAARAKADALVLGLDQTQVVENVGANTTVGQDVVVNATTTIDGFAFFLGDPSGQALTYTLTDLTTSTVLFSETFDDTTLNPALTNIAIPVSGRNWLEVYMSPLTLVAGADIYEFSVSGAGGLRLGTDPTTLTELGLATSGDAEVGLRVWDPPSAVTPEPNPLVLLGTGIMAAAGLMRRRLVAQAA